MADAKVGLCESCRELKPVAYTDPVDREYCAGCFTTMPVATPSRMLEYLLATVPFSVGDRVECRTAGVLYDGIGVIQDISVVPENFGTPVYPSFQVRIEEPAYPEAPTTRWYMEQQLKKVDQ